MPDRADDWYRQAEHDLAQAEDSRSAGRHDWACFAAHQAAEKAAKALHLAHGQEAWGQVVARLLEAAPPAVPLDPGLIERARVLDNFYIPTRYPNGHAEQGRRCQTPAFFRMGLRSCTSRVLTLPRRIAQLWSLASPSCLRAAREPGAHYWSWGESMARGRSCRS